VASGNAVNANFKACLKQTLTRGNLALDEALEPHLSKEEELGDSDVLTLLHQKFIITALSICQWCIYF